MKHPLFEKYPDHFLDRFRKYHQENPGIFMEFENRAQEMRRAGKNRYGSRGILEVIRWHINLRKNGDVFKINNDYAPLYARLLIYKDESFRPFFELRDPPANAKWNKSKEQREREDDE